MIVLDLQSELYPQYHRLPSYYGQPFIWCMLHNYGAVTGLYGSLEQINNVSTVIETYFTISNVNCIHNL